MAFAGAEVTWSSEQSVNEKKVKKAPNPSYLLVGEVEKPWLSTKDGRVRASWWITVVRIFL
jgi:hypothetical protein